MKILIIGGMHGNETLGIELVESLLTSPIDSVDAVIANQSALDANVRFTGQDLNRSFPGNELSAVFEERRAAELIRLSAQYDIVLDFHNTWCPNNDCSFVGESADDVLLNVSEFLGLDRVIIADYDCMNKYALNCISIEVSMQSQVNNVNIWREKIERLSMRSRFAAKANVKTFRFVYRMTLEDKDMLRLDMQNLRAFVPITPQLAHELGVASPAFPIFINDRFTPYNYGGLLNSVYHNGNF